MKTTKIPGGFRAGILLFLASLILIGFISIRSIAATPVFSDNLSNNSINPATWNTVIVGTGPTVSATNQSVITTLPANSSNDPQAQIFYGGLESVCLVTGDFDAQVDFKLLLWPQSSGVRVGLAAADLPQGVVERTAWGPNEGLGLPREVYLTDFADRLGGITATNNLNGTLRLVRTGSLLSGYYLSPSGWVLIHTGPASSAGPSHLKFQAWSHNAVFGGQAAKVGFNNFSLNSGQLLCPRLSLSPSNGPVGTKVQVQASGFSPSNTGTDQVQMSFDGNFLGVAANVNGNFVFTFDVPEAQPGPHSVTALDQAAAISVNASFRVTRIDTTSVSVDVGTLYFPGNTAVIYTLATLSGTPLNSTTVQLQLTLTRPDGARVTLNNSFVGGGLFKAKYTIPKTGPTGTYAIVASAHVANVQDTSALGTFEVTPSWLSAQGPALTTAAIAVSGIAAVGVAVWRSGLFRSKVD